jgi:uncharacterized membrane protein
MGIFSFFSKKQDWFSPQENESIVNAIRTAEKRTSGEIRVFVESRCSYVDAIDRAAEVFFGLKMDKTEDRNGVVLYIAMKDQQLAVYGDKGIYEKVGTEFWNKEVFKMLSTFKKESYAEGIIQIVKEIGDALVTHFPYENEDRNELPDDIVFGH